MTVDVPIGIAIFLAGLFCLLRVFPAGIVILNDLPFVRKKFGPLKQKTTKILYITLGIFSIALGLFYPLQDNIRKPAACIYAGAAKTDAEAISWLINQEARVTVSGDMEIIQTIFAEDATIVDHGNRDFPVVWKNPIDRYGQLFMDAQFIDARNTNSKAVGMVGGDTAYYISGSEGAYLDNGQKFQYLNPDDANHWTLAKINGCWQITKFEFNASGIQFP
jgi:hypothetical protein